jgi:thiol-disulfide isomerase/thioredoxin
MDKDNNKNTKKNLPEKVDSAITLAKIIKNNNCVVIKISASWCGPCKNIKFLESYSKLKNNYTGVPDVKFVELDIDRDSWIIEDKINFDIDVNVVPTFFISKNGNFTRKFEGLEHLQTINKYLYDNIANK